MPFSDLVTPTLFLAIIDIPKSKMLNYVKINRFWEDITKTRMSAKSKRGYTARHEQIRNKLIQMANDNKCGCIRISRIATELGMDQRTVKAHLKIIEMDKAGVFLDPEEKEFCTKEGISLLANKLGLKEIAVEQKG